MYTGIIGSKYNYSVVQKWQKQKIVQVPSSELLSPFTVQMNTRLKKPSYVK